MADSSARPLTHPPSSLSTAGNEANSANDTDTATPGDNTQDTVVPPDASSNSFVVLFLRSLRLLDLHLLPDWPGITLDTFKATAKESHLRQKARIQSAEWVFYKLFELWDLRETKISLRPYFPAFEPAQSTKLRANLFQWLNKLKETRALGRDFTLRKSILDECKGERFEEILFLLSSAVLRKVVFESDEHGSGVHRIAATNHITATDESTLFDPLLIAHRNSLASLQQQKGTKRAHLQRLSRILKSRQKQLDERIRNCKTTFSGCDNVFKTKSIDLDATKKILRQEVASDARVLSIFISGEGSNDRNSYYEQDFETVWRNTWQKEQNHTTQPDASADSSNSLLDALERQLQEQRTRLENWRMFQGELSRRNEELIVIRSPPKPPAKPAKQSARSVPKTSPKRNPRKASSPDKSRSKTRPVSFAEPPISETSKTSSKPRQETAVRRASQKLSSLTMDLDRLDLNSNESTAADVKSLQKDSDSSTTIPTKNPLALPPILAPSPLTTMPTPAIPAGRRSPTKIPQGVSRLPRPGHQRSGTTEALSSSHSSGPRRISVLGTSALQEANTVDADLSKKSDVRSKDSRPTPEAVSVADLHIPHPSSILSEDTASAGKVNSHVNTVEPEPDGLAQERPILAKTKTLAERTRQSMAMFNDMINEKEHGDAAQETPALTKTKTLAERARQSLALSNDRMSLIVDAPAGVPSNSKESGLSASSFQKGHKKIMSAQANNSQPRFPVNPFNSSSEADATMTTLESSALEQDLSSDLHSSRMKESLNSASTPIHVASRKHPRQTKREEKARPAPTLIDGYPGSEEDAENAFKSRSKLRSSPPPSSAYSPWPSDE